MIFEYISWWVIHDQFGDKLFMMSLFIYMGMFGLSLFLLKLKTETKNTVTK